MAEKKYDREKYRKRKHNIILRLNDEEYEDFIVRVEKSGLTKQQYLLMAVQGSKTIPAEELRKRRLICKKCYDQIRGAAVNINQIAKLTNQSRSLQHLERLEEEIDKMKEGAMELWRYLRL